MKSNKKKPSTNLCRLSIDIPQYQKAKLQKYLRWGETNYFLNLVINDIVDALEKDGRSVLAAYVARRITIGDLSDMFKKSITRE